MQRIALHPRAKDLSGRRFSRLVALAPVHRVSYGPSKNVVYYRCVCDCGAKTDVSAWNLTTQKVQSCGCLAREVMQQVGVDHGASGTPEHEVWMSITKRTTNPNDRFFDRYGGRGIRMCDAWAQSFDRFLADMGPRPSPRHSIERLDNDGDYEPGNCVWAVAKTQARNRSSTVWLEIDGERRSMAEWAEIHGISYAMVQQRIKKYGFDPKRALTTPPKR